jgi:sugar lactone lactonase YvrE
MCLGFLVTPLWAGGPNPSALATLSTGQLAVLDDEEGIFIVAGQGVVAHPVSEFHAFTAVDFTAVRLNGGDAFFVSRLLRANKGVPFARLTRFNTRGQTTGEWSLNTLGWLAGIAVDPSQQVAYCSDSRLGEVYRLDTKLEKSSFSTLVKIRDAGTLGSVLLDSKRRRLLVADIEKSKIYSVSLPDKRVDVVLANASMREPAAMALDVANDRLYIADTAQRKIWVGSLTDPKLKIRSFGDSVTFREPIGLAVGSDGSLWVADRGAHQLLRFSAAGVLVGKVGL